MLSLLKRQQCSCWDRLHSLCFCTVGSVCSLWEIRSPLSVEGSCERQRSRENTVSSCSNAPTTLWCKATVQSTRWHHASTTKNGSLTYACISLLFCTLKKHSLCVHFTFESITLMLRVCIIKHHLLHASLLIAAAESSESFAKWEVSTEPFALIWYQSAHGFCSFAFIGRSCCLILLCWAELSVQWWWWWDEH